MAVVAAAIAALVSARVIEFHRQLSSQRVFFLGDVHLPDPEIGYVLRPRSDGTQVLDPTWKTPVKVDRLGFRIPLSQSTETVVQPGGVVGIGCSFMFGHGLPAEQTIPYLLGDALHLPAYNLGVCGYASASSYLLLRRSLPLLNPSVVVYLFPNFHIERSFAPSPPSSRLTYAYLTTDSGRIAIHPPLTSNETAYELIAWLEPHYAKPLSEGLPTPLTPTRFIVLLEAMAKAFRGGMLSAPAVASARLPSEEDYGRFVLGSLLAETRRHGATLVVAYTPQRYGEECSPGVRKAAAELEGAHDFIFVDAAPALFAEARDQGEFTDRLSLAPWDIHPNARRNAVVAAAIARALESRARAFR